VAFLPADIDRRFGRDNLPDHGDLLANLARWAAGNDVPLEVHGPGLIDCHLYRQEKRLILHLINLTSAGTWRQPVHELIPVGPLSLKAKSPPDLRLRHARSLVGQKRLKATSSDGWIKFELDSILDHELVVLT
jgi:hypothetical protein